MWVVGLPLPRTQPLPKADRQGSVQPLTPSGAVPPDPGGPWSMLFVAEPSVLRVSTELGRLDPGAVTAGMGLRQAVEELERLHPDLGG